MKFRGQWLFALAALVVALGLLVAEWPRIKAAGGGQKRRPDAPFDSAPVGGAAKPGVLGDATMKVATSAEVTTGTQILAAHETGPDSLMSGGIVGRVTDKGGKPVAGVVIQRAAYADLAHPVSGTKTGSDGRYALAVGPAEDQQPGGLVLAAIPKPPFAPAMIFGLEPCAEGSPLVQDFVLAEGGWLGVKIVGDDGKPLSGISVSVSQTSGDLLKARAVLGLQADQRTTDAQGGLKFEALPGSTVVLRAQGWGYQPVSLPSVQLNRTITLTMSAGAVIHGRVVEDESGAPVKAFTVAVEGPGVNGPAGRDSVAFTDEAGRFAFNELGTDMLYGLIFDAAERVQERRRTVLARTKAEAEELVVRLKKGTALIVEVVAGETDAPLAGATVSLVKFTQQYEQNKNMWGFDLVPDDWGMVSGDPVWALDRLAVRTTDAAGRAEFVEGLEMDRIMITAKGRKRTSIDAGSRGQYRAATGMLRIPLEKGVGVRGRLTDAGGTPLAGRAVALQTAQFPATISGSDGGFTFDGLEPNGGQLAAFAGRGTESVVYTKSVQIGAEAVQTINLGDNLGPHVMRGKITLGGKPLGGAGITFNCAFEWEYLSVGTVSGPDGAYEVAGLKTGAYRVNIVKRPAYGDSVITSGGFAVQVNGDEKKDFDLAAGHRVSGRLVFPEGMEDEERARYSNFSLRRVSGPGAPNGVAPYDPFVSFKVEGDKAEGNGRLLGQYEIFASLALPGGGVNSVSTTRRYAVDNIEQDQDLGDIPVPAPSGVRLRLTFAREEERRNFTIVKIVSTLATPSNQHSESPPEFTSLAGFDLSHGTAIFIEGHFKGDHYLELHVSPQQNAVSGYRVDGPVRGPSPYRNAVRIPGRYRVNEPDGVTDLGEVIVYPIYVARVRVISTDPAVRIARRLVRLVWEGDEGDGFQGANGVNTRAECYLDDNGLAEFHGLFMGRYKVTLDTGNGVLASQFVNVANGEGDVDLGRLEIGAAASAEK